MFNSNDPEAAREKWALPRRDFLVLGSAAMAGAVASSLTAGTVRAIAMPAAGAVLSVGYTDAVVDRRAAGEADPPSRLIAAKSLRLADPRFDAGVRVVVHGLSRPAARITPASISLTAFAPGADSPVPFVAAVYSLADRGRLNRGRGISFVAALDKDGTLPIAVERRDLTSTPARRFGELFSFARNAASPSAALPDLSALEKSGSVCRLSSGSIGDVRLRPGTYFIALRQSYAQPQPDWSSIVHDGKQLSCAGRPVDFEYLTLSIGYAV